MKTVVVFTIFAIHFTGMHCHGHTNIRRTFREIQSKCLRKTPVSKDVMAKLYNQELVDDGNLKKYVYCVARGTNMVNTNGTYNNDNLKKAQATFGYSRNFIKIIDDCTQHPVVNDGITSFWTFIRCCQKEETGSEFAKLIKLYWHLEQ